MYENGLPCSPYAPGAVMIRIKEVTHDQNPEVVFDLQLFDPGNTNITYQGTFGYRSHRIPDLYGHLLKPIDDLTVKFKNGTPSLEFSADQTKAYAIEASNDLINWSEIGVATPDPESAAFNFNDPQLNASARFYRVKAQQ
jgi:hypothetical protein